jgi:hypothetical protein
MFVSQMFVRQMSVDQMSVGQISVGQMVFDQKKRSHVVGIQMAGAVADDIQPS